MQQTDPSPAVVPPAPSPLGEGTGNCWVAVVPPAPFSLGEGFPHFGEGRANRRECGLRHQSRALAHGERVVAEGRRGRFRRAGLQPSHKPAPANIFFSLYLRDRVSRLGVTGEGSSADQNLGPLQGKRVSRRAGPGEGRESIKILALSEGRGCPAEPGRVRGVLFFIAQNRS